MFHIESGDLLDILEHPNPDRHAGQRIFVVEREDYVYLVPFVEDEHTVLHLSAQGPRAGVPAVLKAIIRSRKATKSTFVDHLSAGWMFWFPRKKFVGSYFCLSAASRW